MNAFAWDLIGSSWEIVTVGLLLFVFLAVVAGPESDDSEDEEDARDEGAEWDRGHDRWVADELGAL